MDIGGSSSSGKEKKVTIIILAGVVLLIAALFGQSSPPPPPPPPSPTLTVSPTTASGGATVTWTATGCTPNGTVNFDNSATGGTLATATANSSGTATGTWTVVYPVGSNTISVAAYDATSGKASGPVTISTSSSQVAKVVTAVHPTLGTITGTVTDVNGHPLAGITTSFGDNTVNTSPNTFINIGTASTNSNGVATLHHTIDTTLYYRASAGGVRGNVVKG